MEPLLLERWHELERLRAGLRDASAGSGRVVAIEGPAGIGKTSLLLAAVGEAPGHGVTALIARAGRLERDLPWNLVRQLFARIITGEGARTDELLQGAAGLARPALGLERTSNAARDPGTLHGLYWLTTGLAARGPLLLAVDDAHWGDIASLHYLAYLGARVADLPLLVLVAMRSGEERPEELQALGALPATERLLLEPLSDRASAELTRASLGSGAAEEFCLACHTAAAGNPFLLKELLGQLERERVEPSAAHAREVDRVTPEAVRHAVLARLAALPPAATELARAVALLGEHATLSEAARLGQLELGQAARAADLLASGEILGAGSPLRFVHPMVREAISAEIPVHQRALGHRRAAQLLAGPGADPQRVAIQLLRTDSAGDEWVVERLREAASGSLAVGAAEPAVEYLRRALQEPPAPALRLDVLLELARAESLSGSTNAIERFQEALAQARGSAIYGAIGAELMFMLFRHGQVERALELAHDVLERLPSEQRGLELRVIAAGATGAVLVPSLRAEMEFFIARIPDDLVGETPEERLALSARLAAALVTDAPMDVAADLAERALGDQMLLEDLSSNELLYWNAASALIVTDRFGAADAAADAALQDARDRGSVIGFALSSAFRCLLDYRVGKLTDGVADGRQAVETVGPNEFQIYAYAVAFLLDCLIETGELEEALSLATRPELQGKVPDVFAVHLLRVARARARIDAGDAGAGVQELLDVGQSVSLGPAMLPWRSRAAPGLVALGREQEAVALVEDELLAGRQTGTGWGQVVALQALALADRGRAADSLQEALELSERHGFALERARSLVLLGAHERRRGNRRRAEELLNDGLEAGAGCGAVVLERRARDELVAIGLSPRRRGSTATDALTPAERRVAQLAAGGMSNREIAQALFVSLRTVETHLTHSYQKLGIGSRSELEPALGAA